MKNAQKILKTIGFQGFLLCILLVPTSSMSAQTNNARRDFMETKEELEAYAAAYTHSINPQPWPGDASKKQEILRHCAEVLRAAIDTNEIDLACSKLTNQPDTVLALKGFSTMTMSNLNEFATILCSPELSTSMGQGGFTAEIHTPTNYFLINFWVANGFPSFVRSIEKRTPDAGHVVESARFYENGQMLELRVNSLDRKVAKGLAFKEDGRLDYHWGLKPVTTKP